MSKDSKNDHEIAHKILSEIKNPDACIQNEMQALHDALNGVGRNNSEHKKYGGGCVLMF